jgi:hypothetical protein
MGSMWESCDGEVCGNYMMEKYLGWEPGSIRELYDEAVCGNYMMETYVGII